jgi:poly-beta-1,6-N-acetyl-D-glucosamine synthase
MIVAAVVFWLCVLLVVYVYAGYPLLLALFARLRPQPRDFEKPPVFPSLTVLIAAYREEKAIAARLENILAVAQQEGIPRNRLQVLVAVDGSEDRTADIVREFAKRGVELSFSSQRAGKMAAINRAMEAVCGKIVIFSDANNRYEAGTLHALIAPFVDPTIGAVTGAKHIQRGGGAVGESEGMYWKYESFIQKQETRLGCCTAVAGEIFAIRRKLFVPQPAYIINDDACQALQIIRAGHRVVYAPKARSFEAASLTAQDEIVRRRRIIAGRYQLMALSLRLLPWRRPLVVWQIVSHKFLRPLVPFAMLGALAANLAAVIFPPVEGGLGVAALLRLAPPYNWVLFALQMLFYLLAMLGNLVGHAGMLGKLLYLPTFLVNSNLAALSGLISFLSRRQTALWQRARRAEDGPAGLEVK